MCLQRGKAVMLEPQSGKHEYQHIEPDRQRRQKRKTVKGLGQLSVRLKDAEIIVLIRERTHLTRALIEKLPKCGLSGRVCSTGPQ